MGDRFLSSAGTARNSALSMRVPNLAQYWIRIVHPWVQKCYSVLGLGSGGRLLGHFQTPVLHWSYFSLWKIWAAANSTEEQNTSWWWAFGNHHWRPSESCLWGGHLRESLGISKGIHKRNGIGAWQKNVLKQGGSAAIFRGECIAPQFCTLPVAFSTKVGGLPEGRLRGLWTSDASLNDGS